MNEKKEKEFHFFVDGTKYETEHSYLSGADIKRIANIEANYQLFLEEQGNTPDRPIADPDTVPLNDRIKHFLQSRRRLSDMELIDKQFAVLQGRFPLARRTRMSNGAILVEIPEFDLPAGWNIARGTVIFMLPPGYPSAQPDCFWLEPGPVRLADGSVPNAANDANPVPGAGPRGTWFSWHLQSWNPNRDDILTYFNVIAQRLSPAR